MIPAMASDWTSLAAAARRVLAQREVGDAAWVEKGRLTHAEAADRLRIARALVTFWDSVVAGNTPYDAETAWIESRGAEGCYPHELRTDLAAAADRARLIAERSPEDLAAARFAEAVAALAWHARPADHISSIIDVAHVNAAARARRAAADRANA